MKHVKITKIEYNGWKNCVSVSNGIVNIIATTDVGPRILFFGFTGGENIFYDRTDQAGLVGGDQWRIYGGHRLWHGPQVGDRPIQPDNHSVSWEEKETGIVLRQDTETATGIKKEIEISVLPSEAKVKIKHRLTNMGLWSVELCAWALTCMVPGGMEIIPIPKRDTKLLANFAIAFWPWTQPNDKRFQLGENYIFLSSDLSMERMFKIGLTNSEGWAAYICNETMFVKRYQHNPEANYADYSSSYQTYTDKDMLELETLSPMTHLQPEASVEHVEIWNLYENVKNPRNEKEVNTKILPIILGTYDFKK